MPNFINIKNDTKEWLIQNTKIAEKLFVVYQDSINVNPGEGEPYLQLASKCLGTVKIAGNPDLDDVGLMSQNQIGQHQIITFKNIRNAIANTLLNFAKKLDPNTSVNLDYCKKLAWTGTNDSKGYKNLSNYEKDEIENVISGERGNNPDQSNFNQIGKLCP